MVRAYLIRFDVKASGTPRALDMRQREHNGASSLSKRKQKEASKHYSKFGSVKAADLNMFKSVAFLCKAGIGAGTQGHEKVFAA